MPDEYTIHLGRAVPGHRGTPAWIGRTYDADKNHIHSTEGGAELTRCVTEALRAIQCDLEEIDDPPPPLLGRNRTFHELRQWMAERRDHESRNAPVQQNTPAAGMTMGALEVLHDLRDWLNGDDDA